MEATKRKSETIDQLNSYLRGELAAVESYRLALEKLDSAWYRDTLLQCAHSHEDRVRLLTRAILERGGEPAKSSGAWGTFTKLIESSAAAFGEKAAIAALEEGEDHGKADYNRDLDDLEPSAFQLISTSIAPEQQRTHDLLSSVKRRLAA